MGGPDQVPFLFFFYSVPGFFFYIETRIGTGRWHTAFLFFIVLFSWVHLLLYADNTHVLFIIYLHDCTHTRIHVYTVLFQLYLYRLATCTTVSADTRSIDLFFFVDGSI